MPFFFLTLLDCSGVFVSSSFPCQHYYWTNLQFVCFIYLFILPPVLWVSVIIINSWPNLHVPTAHVQLKLSSVFLMKSNGVIALIPLIAVVESSLDRTEISMYYVYCLHVVSSVNSRGESIQCNVCSWFFFILVYFDFFFFLCFQIFRFFFFFFSITRAISALIYNVLKAFMEMNSALFDELAATYKSERQR